VCQPTCTQRAVPAYAVPPSFHDNVLSTRKQRFQVNGLFVGPPVPKGLCVAAECHIHGVACHVYDAGAWQQHLDVAHKPQVAQHLVYNAAGTCRLSTQNSMGVAKEGTHCHALCGMLSTMCFGACARKIQRTHAETCRSSEVRSAALAHMVDCCSTSSYSITLTCPGRSSMRSSTHAHMCPGSFHKQPAYLPRQAIAA
jgi:hypothetical protein